jgi:hypothetical protein
MGGSLTRTIREVNANASSLALRAVTDKLGALRDGYRQTLGPWSLADLPVGLTSTILIANDSTVPEYWVAPRKGSLSAFSAILSAADTNDDLSIVIQKYQTTVRTVTLLSGKTTVVTTFERGQLTFVSGDKIRIRAITPGTWTANNDITVWLEVLM